LDTFGNPAIQRAVDYPHRSAFAPALCVAYRAWNIIEAPKGLVSSSKTLPNVDLITPGRPEQLHRPCKKLGMIELERQGSLFASGPFTVEGRITVSVDISGGAALLA